MPASLAQSYVEQAHHNINTAEFLARQTGFEDWSFWTAFQATELALKAMLIALGRTEQETKTMRHDLTKIISSFPECARNWASPWLQGVKEMWDLYPKADRYPSKMTDMQTGNIIYQTPMAKVTPIDMQKHLQTANEVLRAVEQVLPKLEQGLTDIFS